MVRTFRAETDGGTALATSTQTANPAPLFHISLSQLPEIPCKMLLVAPLHFTFPYSGALPRASRLPFSLSASSFLPPSALLLSLSQSEEAGHRFAEWEEGSVINGILCCLHKHLKYTDS